jgi:hypothetical protein
MPPTVAAVACAPRGAGIGDPPLMTLRAATASGVRANRGLNQCRKTKLVVLACQLAIGTPLGRLYGQSELRAKIRQ